MKKRIQGCRRSWYSLSPGVASVASSTSNCLPPPAESRAKELSSSPGGRKAASAAAESQVTNSSRLVVKLPGASTFTAARVRAEDTTLNTNFATIWNSKIISFQVVTQEDIKKFFAAKTKSDGKNRHSTVIPKFCK